MKTNEIVQRKSSMYLAYENAEGARSMEWGSMCLCLQQIPSHMQSLPQSSIRLLLLDDPPLAINTSAPAQTRPTVSCFISPTRLRAIQHPSLSVRGMDLKTHGDESRGMRKEMATAAEREKQHGGRSRQWCTTIAGFAAPEATQGPSPRKDALGGIYHRGVLTEPRFSTTSTPTHSSHRPRHHVPPHATPSHPSLPSQRSVTAAKYCHGPTRLMNGSRRRQRGAKLDSRGMPPSSSSTPQQTPAITHDVTEGQKSASACREALSAAAAACYESSPTSPSRNVTDSPHSSIKSPSPACTQCTCHVIGASPPIEVRKAKEMAVAMKAIATRADGHA
ncbi:hypothetical protein R3P38DRAFT_3218632 [Favolaschia claudopus]|uniref:Uncharacterized protein n=1 Tax=Favolaschia claudopus TaxID=2862362 RepID=A0AAW0A2Y3_9AGAR